MDSVNLLLNRLHHFLFEQKDGRIVGSKLVSILEAELFVKARRKSHLRGIVLNIDHLYVLLRVLDFVDLGDVFDGQHEEPTDGDTNAGGSETPIVFVLNRLLCLGASNLGEKHYVFSFQLIRHVSEVAVVKRGSAFNLIAALLKELGLEPIKVEVLHLVLLHS